MEERKYELLTNESIEINDHKLYRIKALRDFGNVKKGDLGGYIEKEDNLSHEGNCWIYNKAIVFDNAMVYSDARVFGNARVSGNAKVYGYARVYGAAYVSGNVRVFGTARVLDYAQICDNTKVYDNACVRGYTLVSGNTQIYGDTDTRNITYIDSDADISSNHDYVLIKGIDTRHETITFFKCKDDNIKVNCEKFKGTLDDYINDVNMEFKDDDIQRELCLSMINVVKNAFIKHSFRVEE